MTEITAAVPAVCYSQSQVSGFFRRVRDQLIQQERYALAIDISTKSGLDPSNVWLSWGRCLLKVGKFTEAHDKLSKCLKIPIDRSQINPPSSASLEEIMEVIQEARMPRKGGTIGADSIIDLVLRGDILKPETVHPSVVEHENFRKMTECLHYQELYGTHTSLLKFYIKRGLVQKALEYSLREVSCCSNSRFFRFFWFFFGFFGFLYFLWEFFGIFSVFFGFFGVFFGFFRYYSPDTVTNFSIF